MNESIVKVCNEYVQPDDDFYILGDCILGRDWLFKLNLLEKLNGKRHIICGNHDSEDKILAYKELPGVIVEGEAKTIRYKGMRLFLCHYPTAFSPIGPYYRSNRLCLCGHSHTTDCWADIKLGSFHVEWDAWKRPVEIEEILRLVRNYDGVYK